MNINSSHTAENREKKEGRRDEEREATRLMAVRRKRGENRESYLCNLIILDYK